MSVPRLSRVCSDTFFGITYRRRRIGLPKKFSMKLDLIGSTNKKQDVGTLTRENGTSFGKCAFFLSLVVEQCI